MQVHDTTRAELEEALRNLVESARRLHDDAAFYARAHERINAVLDDWQAVA